MMRSPILVSRHAVQRYIERHRPALTYKDAEAELVREMQRATFHELPAGEDPIYRTPSGVLLVVSIYGTVRTCLPLGATRADRRPRKAKGRR